MSSEEEYEYGKKMLKALGAQPHQINATIRDAKDHEKNGIEIYQYAKEIMGIEGQHIVWSIARALNESFAELENDPGKMQKIQLILQTLASAALIRHLKSESEKQKPAEE